MERKLEYFLDLERDDLYAYGSFCEFFEKFNKEEKTWQTSHISFSQFLHDAISKRISTEQANDFTGGNLPDSAYEAYIALFQPNASSNCNKTSK